MFQRFRAAGAASETRPGARPLLAVLLGVAMATASVFPVAAADEQAELKSLRARIESVRKEATADLARRDALSSRLREAELAVQTARHRLEELRQRRVASETRLKQLRSERSRTEQQIAAERSTLAAQVRVAYMNGREERLKLLLSQQDPATFGRMLVYYSYFGTARAEQIASIRDHLAHLDLIASSTEEETLRLRRLESEQAGQLEALSGARVERAQALASLEQRISNRTEQLARLERQAKDLERLIERLQEAMADFPVLAEQPFAKARGRLPWPVKGKLLARFGQPRADGALRWQGVLIGTERGTQVRAPFYGRVVYADWLPGLGLLLIIDHGDGYMSLYGHNEVLYKAVGERVLPGDVIAAVGDSGGSARSGLYVEIRKGRQALDPLAWLRKS